MSQFSLHNLYCYRLKKALLLNYVFPFSKTLLYRKIFLITRVEPELKSRTKLILHHNIYSERPVRRKK